MSSPELTIPQIYSQLITCKKNCIAFETNRRTAVQTLQRTLTGSAEYHQLLHNIDLYKKLLQVEYEKMYRLTKLVDDINAKAEKPLPLNKPPPKSKSSYNPSPIRIKVNPRPEIQLGPEAKKSKKEGKKEESDGFDDDWPGDKCANF
uniref:Uncharacterized protein n=1 Tax=Panagrolaimus davidi TaxID=227884 RepID=A0A914QAY2_9BILA